MLIIYSALHQKFEIDNYLFLYILHTQVYMSTRLREITGHQKTNYIRISKMQLKFFSNILKYCFVATRKLLYKNKIVKE